MKNLWNKLSRMFERLSRLGAVLAEISLILLLALVFHEVIARYVLNKPTLYSVELSEYLLIFVAFMAVGFVMQQDGHVRMPSLINLMPVKVRRIINLLTSTIVLGFCLVLTWHGAKASLMAFKGGYHSSSLLNVPMWIPYAIIPTGALLLVLQIVVQIGRIIERMAGSDNQ